MRSTIFSLALAVAVLAFVAAPDARAQWVYSGPTYYYGPAYYPPVYYTPYVAGYYGPSYYWYGNYYNAPAYRGWSYGSYSPYTNGFSKKIATGRVDEKGPAFPEKRRPRVVALSPQLPGPLPRFTDVIKEPLGPQDDETDQAREND